MDKRTKIYYPLLVILIICLIIAHVIQKDDPYDPMGYIYDNNDYIRFIRELDTNMDLYGIPEQDQININAYIEQLLYNKEIRRQENKKKKIKKKLLNISQKGVMRGALIGAITAGAPGAATNAVLYGTIPSFIEWFNGFLS